VSIQKAQAQDASLVSTAPATDSAPFAPFPSQDGAASIKSPTVPVPSASKPSSVVNVPVPPQKKRLPGDVIGQLEDRIAEDPRGDMDAWLSLISEHRRRNKLDEARSVFDRFFKVFPHAAEQWVAYANMELENDDFYRLEQIFAKALMTVPNVQLWSIYLDYVRRRNNLTTDSTGQARQIVTAAFDFVLKNIGIDKDSGHLWQEFVNFVRSSPGVVGGNGWQDQQKADIMRKTFQQATTIPTSALQTLWKEYEQFETGLNKQTGRKVLMERSPLFVTARSANVAIQNITKDLKRTTLPRLPPAMGYQGDTEYMQQVELWEKWIRWEIEEDPLVLKDDETAKYKERVVYVFKQAVMALRFWPRIWYDAAEFCFQNGMDSDGNDFLTQGIAANPESCLLAFKKADRAEMVNTEDGGNDPDRRRKAVREPYEKLLEALYELSKATVGREAQMITRIQEEAAQDQQNQGEEDDLDAQIHEITKEAEMRSQTETIKKNVKEQVELLKNIISHVWIAKMRAMRRVEGKGTGKAGD
ncbi:hypothetical protein LTS18_010429, partial [Coniosporium uncinatum]